jgi:AcrR family transcriptional regulator
MARPRSEDKRHAILAAATRIFAERGLGAPTSAIAAAAGVAEGTLFTYFPTKDELINVLYREIKLDVADAMMSGFPRRKSVRTRLEHVWNSFTQWGVANPLQQKALRHIEVWSGLTAESRAAGTRPFSAIRETAEEGVSQRIIQDLPQPFLAAAMSALAETTVEFMRQHPKKADTYRAAGFQMLWDGITRKR